MPTFGTRRGAYNKAVAYQRGLYSNGRLTNARARNAARTRKAAEVRALWAARFARARKAAGEARNAAVSLTKKAGRGLYAGGVGAVAAAAAAAAAAKKAAGLVAGKIYGAAGAAAQGAARAASAAAKKVRSYSALRRVKGAFLGTAKLSESEKSKLRAMGITNLNSTRARNEVKAIRGAAAGHLVRLGNKSAVAAPVGREGGLAGKMRSAARVVSEKAKAAAAAVGAAAAAGVKKVRSMSLVRKSREGLGAAGAFLSRKAGNAGAFLSRKAGNLKSGASNLYARLGYGGHEKKLEAERRRAANAVNAAKASLNREKSAGARAAGATLGEIAAKLKKAESAAANGAPAAAAAAIGSAAKSASKPGLLGKLKGAAKSFISGAGARLRNLGKFFKGTRKNSPAKAMSPMFVGSSKNESGYKKKGPNSRSAFVRRMANGKAASARRVGSFSQASRKENQALKSLRNAQIGARAGLLAGLSPAARQRLGRFQNF